MGLIGSKTPGRLLERAFPDPCAKSAELRRQALDDEDEGSGDGTE
jgi:hypothetical protein